MRSIQYKGSIYIEAAAPARNSEEDLSRQRQVLEPTYVESSSHKKCKKGAHWNGIKHTCEKIPPELQSRIDKANTRSEVAHKASASKDHTKAWHRHNLASRAHYNVSQAAQKTGYWDLERLHRKKGGEHYKKMVHHAKYRKVTPPTAPIQKKQPKKHWKDFGTMFDSSDVPH